MKPDLESLYSQLDLQPDCSLEEFQRAYRRRIGELHPDRNQGTKQSAETRRQLRHLLWMHATVNRFHRRYGRMPGAFPGGRRRESLVSDSRSSPATFPESDDEERPGRATWILMLLLIALMVLGTFWNWLAAGPQVSTQIHADVRSHCLLRSAPCGYVPDVQVRDHKGDAFASRLTTSAPATLNVLHA